MGRRWKRSPSTRRPRRPVGRPACGAELQRLRTLRELLERFGIGLSDVGFAARLRDEPGLSGAVEEWLAAQALRPDEVPAADWLRWEQEKHEALLAAAAELTTTAPEAA